MWFALSYLYSVNIDSTETRYTTAGNYNTRISAIKRASESQIRAWLRYALNELKRNTKNGGKVTLSEQKTFAKEHYKLKTIKS